MGVRVAMDLYPARVRLPHGGEVRPCRVTVADDVLTVWTSTSGGPKPFWQRAGVLSSEGNHISGYSLQVADGTVDIYSEQGCGCGSDLKLFDPWDGASRQSVQL